MEMKESLTAQIAAKGEEIKVAKAAKVDKAALQPLIDALLALKAEYEVVVGEPFPNPNARGGKKKKVGGSAGGGEPAKGGVGPKQPSSSSSDKVGLKVPDDKSLLAALHNLGLSNVIVKRHAPVVTVKEMMVEAADLPGGKAKNLFLKDKKGHLFLVSALHDTDTTTKKMEVKFGIKSGTLRLVDNAELLMSTLGVVKGAVSPFCVVNDTDCKVQVVLDEHFRRFERLCFHPMTNAATMSIKTMDMVKFLGSTNHPPVWFDFGGQLGMESQAIKDAPPPAAAVAVRGATEQAAAPSSALSVQVAALPDRNVVDDIGFYVLPGVTVWACEKAGDTAWAAVVKRQPADEVGVWTVVKVADESEHGVHYDFLWPRSIFNSVAFAPAPAPTPASAAAATLAAAADCDAGASFGGGLLCQLIAPPDGKGAAMGGQWSVHIGTNPGTAAGVQAGGLACKLIAPLGGESAAQGGQWTVKIGAVGVGAGADGGVGVGTGVIGGGSPPAPPKQPLIIPSEPKLAAPALPPFGADQGPVKRCQTVLEELGINIQIEKHAACVASEGQTSNQHHHQVLTAKGHIVVTLFLKGAKKKELLMLVKKASTKLDLKVSAGEPIDLSVLLVI